MIAKHVWVEISFCKMTHSKLKKNSTSLQNLGYSLFGNQLFLLNKNISILYGIHNM